MTGSRKRLCIVSFLFLLFTVVSPFHNRAEGQSACSPCIGSITPAIGVPGVGLSIAGTGFGATQGTSTVTLNGQPLNISSWSDASISTVLPVGATSGNVVVSVAGVNTNPIAFSVVSPTSGFVRSLTVPHGEIPSSDQVAFPMLVSGVYPSLATLPNGGRGNNISGYDVVFTSDADGHNLLPFEIDSYNPVSGSAAFWVLIPVLSHTSDTTIYMWYGIPGLSQSQENRAGVWSSGYAGVWHFGTPSSAFTADSSGNGNQAINNGVTQASGVIGGSGSFDGSGNTFFDVPASNSYKPSSTLTLEAWVITSTGEIYPNIFSLDYTADGTFDPPYSSYALGFNDATLEPRLYVAANSGIISTAANGNVTAGQWTHMVGTYDGAHLLVYANGQQVASLAQSGPIGYGASKDLAIGTRSPYAPAQGLDGLIDEARISTVARSSDWISTEYLNQSNPSGFYRIGIETAGSGASIPVVTSISPNPAPAGALIVVSGSGFGGSQGSSTLMLNGTPMSVTSWSDTALSAMLPPSLSSGSIVVAEQNLTSNAISISIEAPPALESLSPSIGVPGARLTITGSGFGTTQGSSSVALNGQPLGVNSWSATAICATLPAGASTGNVVVSVGGVGSTNSLTFTVVSPSAGYVRAVTFPHTEVPNTDQLAFPVLISGTYPFLATVANNGRGQSTNGYDIIFTSDPAGQNLLPFEIDTYDGLTGTAGFWVQVPLLSHTTDTTLYMWYGIPGLNQSQENKAAVWSNGYGAVWHFGTASSGFTTDSTSNGNDAVNKGVVQTLGMIGNSGSFDGTGYTYFDIPSSSSYKPASTITLEAWVNTVAGQVYPNIFSLDYTADGTFDSPYSSYALGFNNTTLEPRLYVAANSDIVSTAATSNIAFNQWTHMVGTYDGAQLRVYANGVQVSSFAQGGPIGYGASKDLAIGTRSPYAPLQGVEGLLDEARISTVVRSSDWIAAEYQNQLNPSGFYHIGVPSEKGQ